MPRFDLMIFDWDGTISNSSAVIVLALQRACRELSLPVPSESEALSIIGLGMREALFQAAPTLKEDQFEPLCRAYREAYFQQDETIRLYPGVSEGLTSLKASGVFLAVATGKSRAGLSRALEKTALYSLFDATCCADAFPSKPAPDMIDHLLDYFGVDADRAVMIGDTTHDLMMARNAKIASVAMTYGAHPKDALTRCGPRADFDRFDALVRWLLETPGDAATGRSEDGGKT